MTQRGHIVTFRDVRKDLQPFLRAAHTQGWSVTMLGNGHLRWRHPNGTTIHSSSRLNTPDVIRIIRRDLIRAGLLLNLNRPKKEPPMPATTNLGDLLKEAQAEPEPPPPEPEPPPQKSNGATRHHSVIVRELFERAPGRAFRSEEAVSAVQREGASVTPSAVYLSIKELWITGKLHKEGRGVYSWKTVATPPKPLIAGERTGDVAIDIDLQELDKALAAMAAVESIIRKYRGIIADAIKLKAALSGIQLK